MSMWDKTNIGEITLLITKGTTPSVKDGGFTESGVNYIKSESVTYDSRIDTTKFVYISEEVHNKFKRSQLKTGDILFSMAGVFLGKTGIVTEDMLPANTNQALAIIRVDGKKAFFKFVQYFFRQSSIIDFVNNMSGQSAQPNINFQEIRSIDIDLPPLPEQKAIASVLSSLDDKIDLLHRQNKTLEAMAETLFRQWFVEEADGDWMDACLEEHTDVYRGLSYKGSGLTEAGFGLPMHNLNSVYEGGGYKEVGIKFYSGDYKERHLVKPNEIIVANTEQGHEFKLIGYPAIVPSSFGEIGLFSQHIYRLIPKTKNYVTSEYLYYLLMTPLVREQVTSATNGSTVNMLAIDGLQRPVFKLPPKEKVFEFTQQVSLLWKRREVNSSQIRNLEKLRDTLLPKLMSGEVRVEL